MDRLPIFGQIAETGPKVVRKGVLMEYVRDLVPDTTKKKARFLVLPLL
jgi:hypothetical protein